MKLGILLNQLTDIFSSSTTFAYDDIPRSREDSITTGLMYLINIFSIIFVSLLQKHCFPVAILIFVNIIAVLRSILNYTFV